MLEKLRMDLKDAMRNKDKLKIRVIRSLISDIRKIEIDSQKNLSDEEILDVLSKAVKSRNQSIELFVKGGRKELAENEMNEVEIIETYLPQKLNNSEIEEIIDRLISEINAQSMKDMGKVMKLFKSEYGNRADGKVVSEIVKSKLK